MRKHVYTLKTNSHRLTLQDLNALIFTHIGLAMIILFGWLLQYECDLQRELT